jgi:DedD protein
VSSRPKARLQQDYWIQTGAFSALVRAEDAKEILASKGLAPIIDDREVDGQTWYRVRVGPYTSENEANYWLALVRAIDGFDQSQVRSSQR